MEDLTLIVATLIGLVCGLFVGAIAMAHWLEEKDDEE